MTNNCENELSAIWPDDVYVVVGPSSLINQGDMSITIGAFNGWKTRMSRNGANQFKSDPGTGNTYFDYTSITGEFTFSQKATNGEEFIFMAYKPA